MKLSDWARKQGLSYRTAHRLFHAGKLPCKSEQLATGTILVHETETFPQRVVLYARVSSHDQKNDLDRQVQRLRDYCAAKGWPVSQEIREIGSGLNGRRKRLLSLLRNVKVTHLVVEHRDRLARFGYEMVEAVLQSAGRTLVVANESEMKDDLVQDFVDIVTSLCAKIYGRRSARNRAKKALKAAKNED